MTEVTGVAPLRDGVIVFTKDSHTTYKGEGMTELQALVTGAVAGALMASPLKIDVEIETDKDGNYTNKILVTGQSSGEELLVTVSEFGERRRVLVNTRTGETRQWEPGLVLPAQGPLEWELREE